MNYKIFILLLFSISINISYGQKKDYVVTIKTKYGNMVALLYDETPKHKANFIKLAKEHYFDSLLFHRVIQGFMIQGGDPDSKKAMADQHLGSGGPGYTIDAEINPKYFHEKGALSAARLGDQANPTKASSGSQFYIVQGTKMTEDELKVDMNTLNSALMTMLQKPIYKNLQDSLGQLYYSGDMAAFKKRMVSLVPTIEKETGVKLSRDISADKLKAYTTVGGAMHLDDEYTVFGKVIQGLDVIDTIASLPKNQFDRPNEDVRMFVTVEELPRKKIDKLYGYHYAEVKK